MTQTIEKGGTEVGASQPSADRAGRASPQAPSGLGHSATITDAARVLKTDALTAEAILWLIGGAK